MNRYTLLLSLGIGLFACSQEKHEHTSTPPMQPASNTLMLTNSQIGLANITTQKVTPKEIGETLVINAKFVANEDLSEVVSSRAAGRIEKLYIKETGLPVKKGEPLYELYSENLLTLEREYLLTKDQFAQLGHEEPHYATFVKAAEKKLLLYGLTQKQVDALAQSKISQPRIIILSPASGIVSDVQATEGQYVAEGTTLYKLENLKKLWLEAELYPAEAQHVRYGNMIRAHVTGLENAAVEGRVVFLSPEYRANTQITLMRAVVDNQNLKLKPGMQAQVLFTRSIKKALTLPPDAVVRNATGAHVYVLTGVNTFEPRAVKTGIEDFEKVEITDGVSEGDTVAVTGAYLLYSELVLRRGADPMAGQSHSH